MIHKGNKSSDPYADIPSKKDIPRRSQVLFPCSSLPMCLLDAFRFVAQRPGTAMLAVLAIALGTGLSTAMFSVLNGALYKTPDIKGLGEMRTLARVGSDNSYTEESSFYPLRDYQLIRDRQKCFSDMAGFYKGTVNLSGSTGPQRVNGAYVTPDFFRMVMLPPEHGEDFDAARWMQPDYNPVIVSHRLWQQLFRGDPNLIGKEVRINGQKAYITGIVPEGFHYPATEDVWVLIRQKPEELSKGEGNWLRIEGRLRSDIAQTDATQSLDALVKYLQKEHPETYKDTTLTLKPVMEEATHGGPANWLWTLMAAVSIVLLIACANVANLLLARSASRGKELSIRSALGATRWQLIRQLLAESLLLAILGTIGGMIIALWLIDVMWKTAELIDKPFWVNFNLDWRVGLFVAATTGLTALLAGFIPAWNATRININEQLKVSSRTSTDWRLSRFSRVLVVVQIAFSFVLLIGAGLTLQTVLKLNKVNPGFKPEEMLTMRIGLFEEDYPTMEARLVFWEKLQTNVREIPGVAGAAATSWISMYGSSQLHYTLQPDTTTAAVAPASPTPQAGDGGTVADTGNWKNLEARFETVSPSYFDTFGAQLLAGRNFSAQDVKGSESVAIVSESFARRHWADGSALGHTLRVIKGKGESIESEPPVLKIVGVVSDINTGSFSKNEEEGSFYIYTPMAQGLDRFMTLVVRVRNIEPMVMTGAISKQVLRLDPNLPVYFVKTMDRFFFETTLPYRIMAGTLHLYGMVSIFLCAIGIYGVMNFAVNQRRREFGIRLALGARRSAIARLILWQGFWQLVAGLIAGEIAAIFAVQRLTDSLYGVKPIDPPTFITVVILLTFIAMLSCFMPLRRAVRIHPTDTLRYE
ncbi:MAG: ABC transporter permease [Verrucomicrobiota bacterium]|nr:ABC transporter permease [Verrucomicrobiota bacterium]